MTKVFKNVHGKKRPHGRMTNVTRISYPDLFQPKLAVFTIIYFLRPFSWKKNTVKVSRSSLYPIGLFAFVLTLTLSLLSLFLSYSVESRFFETRGLFDLRTVVFPHSPRTVLRRFVRQVPTGRGASAAYT